MTPLARFPRTLAAFCLLCLAAGSACAGELVGETLPPIRHVFVIVLERTNAPYLSRTLRPRGALLENYYAIGHSGLVNYIAMVSGQAPNPWTQRNCRNVDELHLYGHAGLDAHGQALGAGCIYPDIVKTLPGQLEQAGLTWKGYMEDLDADPDRDEPLTCTAGRVGQVDMTEVPEASDEYASEHDPFMFFHAILDNPTACAAHVVNLEQIARDLRSVATTPNYDFIVPNLCHDGRDRRCANGEPGGAAAVDEFLARWVPRITGSAAFRADGLLIITSSQADGGTPADSAACCNERPLASNPLSPGLRGPGGGRVGAVVLSPFIRPGTVSTVPYNHYSLLRTVEDIFGLDHLGFAAEPGLRAFGADVFTATRPGTLARR